MHQSRTRKPLKTSKWRKRGTCAPGQGSGATLGVLGYSYLTYCKQILIEIYDLYSDTIIIGELNI